MIAVETYRDRKVAVMGLGRTGLSVVRTLVDGGAEIVCWDDDPGRRERALDLGGRPEPPSAEGWAGAVAVVLSPGVPLTHPEPHLAVRMAERLGAEVIGDVELFARARPAAPIVAVTGTNGKSTTTSLIAHLLSACGTTAVAGGNLGTPVLDFEVLGPDGVYALELSSYQIDLTNGLRPTVAVLLNISPDHLERHGGMDGYVAVKSRLLEMATVAGRLVVSVDDEWSRAVAGRMATGAARIVEISVRQALSDGFFADGGTLYRAAAGHVQEIANLSGSESLLGAHNWQNATAAIAALDGLGYDPIVTGAALASYRGLPHRMELLGRIDSVSLINDSKATNAESTSHALQAYDNIYWIAGGIAKQGGIASLTPHFGHVARAYLIGEAAPAFGDALGDDVPHEISGDLASALNAAYRAARLDRASEPVILLSPACASFDQFDSFEDRGDVFRQLVADLLNGNDCAPKRAGGAG